MTSPFFKKQIALPQDHGSWVFILSPLWIGFFAGGGLDAPSLSLFVAAMSAFMLRQPASAAVKALSGRRSRDDLPAALFWLAVYGIVAALALLFLVFNGFAYVLYLAVPGAPVFAWHLWLVSRRAERRQAGVEMIATGVLALAAPAAYWVSRGRYDPAGWGLWLWNWLQSAASIVYAYLRLEQREWKTRPEQRELWRSATRALVYTTFNLLAALLAGWANFAPRFLFIPFLLQWLETLWGATHPSTGWKPTRIGVRQLIVSAAWTALFIAVWR